MDPFSTASNAPSLRCLPWATLLVFSLCACPNEEEPQECPEPEETICQTLDELSSEVMVFGDCADELDNDGDELVDCLDEDCAGDPACDLNEAPSAPIVWIPRISPLEDAVPSSMELQCLIQTTSQDPDEDTIYYRVEWWVDGKLFDYTGTSIDRDNTSDGEEWECRVIPFDGKTEGPSGSVTVRINDNQPPTAPVVEISPSTPTDGQDLDCTVLVPSQDPDGDSITYSFSWEKDGVLTSILGSEILSSQTSSGEVWTCIVTPRDNMTNTGEPGSAEVTIQ